MKSSKIIISVFMLAVVLMSCSQDDDGAITVKYHYNEMRNSYERFADQSLNRLNDSITSLKNRYSRITQPTRVITSFTDLNRRIWFADAMGSLW